MTDTERAALTDEERRWLDQGERLEELRERFDTETIIVACEQVIIPKLCARLARARLEIAALRKQLRAGRGE